MLEEMRGMPAAAWNDYMKASELPYRVKEASKKVSI
jgi:hypothetical protein